MEKNMDVKNLVLKGDTYWEIIIYLKGGENIEISLRQYLEDNPDLAKEWDEHIVAVLENKGFEKGLNGEFVNYAGNIRRYHDVVAIVETMMKDSWVKENIVKIEIDEIGPVKSYDIVKNRFVRDARHPSKAEMLKKYSEQD